MDRDVTVGSEYVEIPPPIADVELRGIVVIRSLSIGARTVDVDVLENVRPVVNALHPVRRRCAHHSWWRNGSRHRQYR